MDNLSAFAGQIDGVTLSSQKIDLGGYAYNSSTETVSWAESSGNTSGTLTVTDGAQVAHLTLQGNYVTSNFTLSNDGAGGTYVVDPPSSGGRKLKNTEPSRRFGATSALVSTEQIAPNQLATSEHVRLLKVGGFVQAMATFGSDVGGPLDGMAASTSAGSVVSAVIASMTSAAHGF